MNIVIAGMPSLEWVNGDGTAEQLADGGLRVTAAAGADWTNDAFGGAQQHAATVLGFKPAGDFALSASVTVSGERTTFDAGVLAIWGDRDHWAKLCFEYSPQGEAMVVSVVTNDFSDDCNSTLVLDKAVHLRITRSGAGWAFHSSADGRTWTFVRVFRLDFAGEVSVGFLAQAPLGDTCVAEFHDIAYSSLIPSDFRNGS